MPPFGKPRFRYDYNLADEKRHVDEFFKDPDRGIPKKKKNELDLASWNIANLGNQKRRDWQSAEELHPDGLNGLRHERKG